MEDFSPKAIANRKIILTDTRQLSNPESDRGSVERHCIGRNLGIINEQLDSGTGMYLLQSTFEAIEKETKLHPQLVVLDFCNANRHRSVAKGTIMSCMLYVKGIEHGLLHLNGMNNWLFMRCGGCCSKCGTMDIPTATRIGQRALEKFKPNVNDHDTSDSAYQQRRPLSVSLPPRSATPGPRSTSLIRGPPATFSSAVGRTSSRPPPTSIAPTTSTLGPCGTVKTTNKVPGVVKQEEPEVPDKEFKGFQTLKLSAQSSSSAGPGPQSEAVAMGPIIPKAKPMPVRRGDALQGHQYLLSLLCPSLVGQSFRHQVLPVLDLDRGSHQHHRPAAWEPPETSSDQAKVKFWRDRALYAEARIAERDRQLQQQGQEILDLSWRAKVAEDWTEWWEHSRHEFPAPAQSRPSTRMLRQPPSPSTERRSRSRSASTSDETDRPQCYSYP